MRDGNVSVTRQDVTEEVHYSRKPKPYTKLQSRTRTTANVGSWVLTAVTMKRHIFWDIPLCSPVKVNWRFGGSFSPHLQVEQQTNQDIRMKQAASRVEILFLPPAVCSGPCLFYAGFLPGLHLYLEDQGHIILQTPINIHRTIRSYSPGESALQ
jgi:hypothetical protein